LPVFWGGLELQYDCTLRIIALGAHLLSWTTKVNYTWITNLTSNSIYVQTRSWNESKEGRTETCGRENGWGRKWEKNPMLKEHDKIVFFV